MSRLVVSNLSINRAELPVVTSVELIAESGAISSSWIEFMKRPWKTVLEPSP